MGELMKASDLKNIHSVSVPKKIADVNLLLLLDHRYAFFGEMILSTSFYKCNSIGTCGVTMDTRGPKFVYNEEFLDTFNEKQLKMLIMHECSHLFNSHTKRWAKYEQNKSNIVQDMIINSYLNKHFGNDIEFPEKAWFVPEDYKGTWLFEELYEWLDDEKNQSKEFKKSVENGESNTIDVHLEDEIPKELKEQILKDIENKTKARGNMSSNMESFLEEIKKSKKDYLSEIKNSISQIKGNHKYKTYSRPNRYGLSGVKGNKKRGNELVCILDTSGSMFGYFERALSAIFQNDVEVNLVQIDTEVKVSEKIKNKHQLQKLRIRGGGGTELQPAIDFVANKYKQNVVILTDGYTDTLNCDRIKGDVLIITVAEKCKVVGSKVVKQVVINDEG